MNETGTGTSAATGAMTGTAPTSYTPADWQYLSYAVVDRDENKIGTLDSVWVDSNNNPAYLGVRTGWLGMGSAHVVPAQSAEVSESRQNLRLPYTAEQVKDAPTFDSSAQLQAADEERIISYYGTYGFRREGWLENRGMDVGRSQPESRRIEEGGETRVQLKEEKLNVGKREVEGSGFRLRKIVRTEVVNQPVELKHEDIVVERVPVAEGTRATDSDFSEQEIYVPLRREEAVVSKEARVREEVRLGKREESEQKTISEQVRREDVEIEGNVSGSRLDEKGERARTTKYEPKERSRR